LSSTGQDNCRRTLIGSVAANWRCSFSYLKIFDYHGVISYFYVVFDAFQIGFIRCIISMLSEVFYSYMKLKTNAEDGQC
jgi:hypothetical protein